MEKIKFEHPALDEPIMVAGKYEVCGACGGHGVHDRRDIDTSALVDSMREDGDDEGLEAYFKGAFDTVCETCGGLRVVFQPVLPEWAEKLIDEYNESEAEWRRESEAERRMGA